MNLIWLAMRFHGAERARRDISEAYDNLVADRTKLLAELELVTWERDDALLRVDAAEDTAWWLGRSKENETATEAESFLSEQWRDK